MNCDVLVVGGGHAGCEAAYAAANIGKKTILVSANLNNIATLPCNPSIGGSAKGIIVREIDALGGIMGRIADKTALQMKMLNSSKGPAVRSLRAQVDKITYPKVMLETLQKQENLQIYEAMVEDLIVENNEVHGIITSTGEKIEEKSDKVQEGYVISQETAENTEIQAGETIKVHVSIGTGIEQVPVIYVIGKTESAAISELEKGKLKATPAREQIPVVVGNSITFIMLLIVPVLEYPMFFNGAFIDIKDHISVGAIEISE